MRRGSAAALALVALAGCNGVEPVPGSSNGPGRAAPSAPVEAPAERLAAAREALSANEVLTRAEEWVDLAVPYCGGVNGGTDHICGGTCNRPAAPWDDYRTDCSGFVSWCWQIPSDPTTETYMTDDAGANGWSTILVEELAPGDAIVCDGHIKLFSQWLSDTEAEIYEEYDCGKVARKAVQSFTKVGNNMFFSGDSRTYHPIRRNGIEPLAAVKGHLDSASVYVKGWAADTNAPDTPVSVDVSFDGAPGEGHSVSLVASEPRPDIGDALAIDPNHGFALLTPLYFCDGLEHEAQAVGHAVEDGAAIELPGSPKPFTCPIPVTPKGVLRSIEGAALDAWKLSKPADLRWMTKEDHATHSEGTAWPAEISIGRTSDGSVWVVDGTIVRHVPSPEALAAWRLDGVSITAWSSADLAKYTPGRELLEAPVLVQEFGDDAVYLLDAESDAPIFALPGSSSLDANAANGDGKATASAGCSVGAVGEASGVGALALTGVAALLRRRRRS